MTDETKTATNIGELDEADDFDFGKAGEGSGEGSLSGDNGDDGKESSAAAKNSDDDSGRTEGTEQSSTGDGGELEGGKKEESKTEEISGEGKKDTGSKSGAGKQEEENGEAGEGEADFFGEGIDESGEGAKTETFDFKSFAPDFGLELEKGTQDEFKEKIINKIEASKKEFKIDGYSADAQLMIKHLNENEGKIDDFFTNDNISSLQGVIGLQAEQKVLTIRTGELTRAGLAAEKAEEQAREEIEDMSNREIKNASDAIDTDARKLISDEISKIVTGREQIISQQKEKARSEIDLEVESMKAHVNSQDEFMGIKLTPKTKQNIVSQIESGVFDEIANQDPSASKFRAYMLAKYGKKIAENYAKIGSVQNRKGHNAALDGQLSALHNTKEGAQSGSSGHQKNEGGERKNFDSWSDEIFEDPSE